MPAAATRADSLRFELSAVEVAQVDAVGSIPGLHILHVAAKNGTGIGRLRTSLDGKSASWRAPGGKSIRTPLDVSLDGSYILEDGDDPDKFVRIQITAAELSGVPIDAEVVLRDLYNNAIASDDVTAAEASAGDQETYAFDLKNDSTDDATDLLVWLDAAVSDIEIKDGFFWKSPTDEASGVGLGSILSGNSIVVDLRRTIGAGATADPAVLTHLHFSFVIRGTKHYLDARGLYRVFNAAVYRFYRSNTTPPVEGDTPFDTSPTLPYEPSATFISGTWWLSMSYFNGVVDSGFRPVGPRGETYLRIDIAAGKLVTSPPVGPEDWRLELLTGGVVRIVAYYGESGSQRATEWAIAFTTDGSDPPADSPTIVVSITSGGVDVLAHLLAAQPDTTPVKVRLQTRRNDDGTFVYSESPVVKLLTVDTNGPAAVLDIRKFTQPVSEGL